MKPSLQVRLSQHLALTPQLQQSIRLLQLSTLELQQEVEQMLEQNPFLETEEEAPTIDTLQRAGARRERRARRAEAADEGARSEARARRRRCAPSSAPPSARTGRTAPSATTSTAFAKLRPATLPAPTATATTSTAMNGPALHRPSPDHLREQLLGMRLSAEDAAAVMVLIDSLDDDGYLADALEEIAERLAGAEGAEARRSVAGAPAVRVAWLQSLEPTGVGARDLPNA